MREIIGLDEKLAAMASTPNDASVNRGIDTTSVFLGSSAVYSGQYNATFTRRNRYSTSSPESCDECCLYCCCGLCTLGSSLICVRQMSRARRIQILWIWVILLALAGGIVCSVGIFGPYTQEVAPTDMRIVNNKLSRYFCDSVTLDSNTAFSAYLYNRQPAIDSRNLQEYGEQATSYVLYNNIKYFKFYLLAGSVITALSCSDVSIELYVIKGHENFQAWRGNHFCIDCTVNSQVITWDCDGTHHENMTVTAWDSDDYYFVYADGVDDTWVSVDFKLRRTLYDTDNASVTCQDNMECSFGLDLHKHQVIVYHISDDFSVTQLSVTSQCNSRLWFYMLAFCACPVVLGCIVSVILYQCCKEPTTLRLNQIRPPRRVLSRFPNERTPLLWGQPPAEVPQPPKYEDIVTGDDTAPPTYDQVTS